MAKKQVVKHKMVAIGDDLYEQLVEMSDTPYGTVSISAVARRCIEAGIEALGGSGGKKKGKSKPKPAVVDDSVDDE